jgi:alpha-tubulin suppressor-like RCC1 family protein
MKVRSWTCVLGLLISQVCRAGFDELPEENLLHIFSFLDESSLASVKKVDHRFQNVGSDKTLQFNFWSKILNQFQYSQGLNQSTILYKGKVYTKGTNIRGCLGLGEAVKKTKVYKRVISLRSLQVTSVQAGSNHSLALTSQGEVYVWGFNKGGVLGVGKKRAAWKPMLIRSLKGIKMAAIRTHERHSLALTEDGAVYSWGQNNFGQLGIWGGVGVRTPILVDNFSNTRITAIHVGQDYSLALSDEGRVYSWGKNEHGQLGNGTTYTGWTPTPIHIPRDERVVAIHGGTQHSLALTESGKVYGWGGNRFGQVGDGTRRASVSKPVQILSLPEGDHVVSLKAGHDYSLALTKQGVLYAWGSNFFAQDDQKGPSFYSVPTVIPSSFGNKFVTMEASTKRSAWAFDHEGYIQEWGDKTLRSIWTLPSHPAHQ